MQSSVHNRLGAIWSLPSTVCGYDVYVRTVQARQSLLDQYNNPLHVYIHVCDSHLHIFVMPIEKSYSV